MRRVSLPFAGRLSGGHPGTAESAVMVTTATEQPEQVGPAKLAVRFLLGAVLSAAVACFVVGAVVAKWSVIGIGGVLVVATYVVAVIRELRNGTAGPRDRPPDPVTLTALARIESRRATGGDTGDVPVEFDLTVQPEDGPAHRVTFSQGINLVDIPDYRPGRVVVVEYRSDQPWRPRIVADPEAEWAERAGAAALDTAPESTRVVGPDLGLASCAVVLAGIAIGAAVVVLVFRADLF